MRTFGLWVPAQADYAPVAGLALCALTLKEGADLDTLSDIRNVVSEAMDCLIHQPHTPERIQVDAEIQDGVLTVTLRALCCSREAVSAESADVNLSRAILETLATHVRIDADQEGRLEKISLSIPLCA